MFSLPRPSCSTSLWGVTCHFSSKLDIGTSLPLAVVLTPVAPQSGLLEQLPGRFWPAASVSHRSEPAVFVPYPFFLVAIQRG